MKIIQETIDLAMQDRGHWPETAEATGLGKEWIRKFAHGSINDPGIQKVLKLNRYLTKKYKKAS